MNKRLYFFTGKLHALEFYLRFLRPSFYSTCDPAFPLLYRTSEAYWMYYRFFGGYFADARVFRTNLMNIFVYFARHRVEVERDLAKVVSGKYELYIDCEEDRLQEIERWNLTAAKALSPELIYRECLVDIQTLVKLSESAKLCLWRYGDEGMYGKQRLEADLKSFGSWDRVENFFALPHYVDATRHISNAEQLARVRYEKAVKDFQAISV